MISFACMQPAAASAAAVTYTIIITTLSLSNNYAKPRLDWMCVGNADACNMIFIITCIFAATTELLS